MSERIEVKIRQKNGPTDYHAYFEWVENECRKAGVPFSSNGEPMNGKLYRLDDPEDFGITIYVYEPHKT